MRYQEIIEVVVQTPALRARLADLERESSELEAVRPIMYGSGPTDGEIAAVRLEADELENERKRLEIELLRRELANRGNLDDALLVAKIQKTQADTAAKLADL